MNSKNLIIIGIIIIIVVCVIAAAYFILNPTVKYTSLKVSGSCELQVPISNDNVSSSDNYGIFHYQDKEHDLNITSYNSEESKSLGGAVQMASIRDKQLLGGKTIIKDNLTVYQDEKTGVYSIFIGNNKTHDNILISCKDLDILIHVANSFDNS